jgi:AbrB family looped-hinge helix DNA binding protein
MPKVRINYDGGLALPAAVRQKLGLTTGDQLDIELIDGSIVPRPVRSGTALDRPAPEPAITAEPTVPVTPEPPPAAQAPVVKRGPGRPRKTPLPVVPATLKARGGKRKAAAADEAAR